MKARCVAAVSAELGRPLAAAEARTIEQRIGDAMRREARKSPETWTALPLQDQLRMGAEIAAKELVAEAQLKRLRVGKQIEAWDRVSNYLDQQVAEGNDGNKVDAISRLIAPKNDGKNNTISMETNAKGIEAAAMGKLVDTWEAIFPNFMGMFRNKDAERAFVLEVHGTDTGISEIKQAVKAWKEAAETLRQRFNAAGGMVGKLEDWGMPHSWSRDILIKVGRENFVDAMMPLIDRRQYVHPDGRLFDDVEMSAFLGNAWLSIASDGANKLKPEPMPGGVSVKANRNSAHREIHFKDGQAALTALGQFSDRNLFQMLTGHVKRMASDIATIEQFGPNADHAFETLQRQAYQEAAVKDPAMVEKLSAKLEENAHLYDYVAGNNPPPVSRFWANFMGDIRAWLSAAKLGSATISSIADEGTLYLTAHVNNLPKMQVFMNELRGFNLADRTEKAMAQRAGLMVKTMMADINRFSADSMGPRWSQKMSGFFMKLSGLEAMTEVRRRAFSVTMMDTLGKLTRELDSVDRLDKNDWKFLASKGIDNETWQIWRQATPETWGGNHSVLTPESIYRLEGVDNIAKEKAATRLLSTTLEEQDIAVIEPGARERADMAAGSRAGTFKGELLRSIFLFKSFPHAMISRHVHRGMGAYEGWQGKAGYLASLVALQTIMGAVAMEVNDVLSGRDPRNLNPMEKFGVRNWIAAVLKGGALGVYGDFLFDEAGAAGRSPVETMAGPVLGTVAAGIALTQGNAVQYLRGEDTHAGAEFARFMRGIVPGSNLWYAKAALDHLIFQNMQEYFSPGYLADSAAKAREKSGTSWWWKPGQSISDAEAPNVANIAGVKP